MYNSSIFVWVVFNQEINYNLTIVRHRKPTKGQKPNFFTFPKPMLGQIMMVC